MKFASILASGATLASFLACSPTEALDLETSTTAEGLTQSNGLELNGIRVNGIRVNGIRVNGIRVNGTGLEGVTIDGTELSGSDFIGAELDGFDENGQRVPIRVDDMRPGTGKNADIWEYWVSYSPGGTTWLPFCGKNGGARVAATILRGRWDYGVGIRGGGKKIDDPDTFTFACFGFALAKCAQFGYKPWVSSTLDDHHQACTRMLRADYCGDGRAHTVSGRMINVYDAIGIETDTQSWPLEAEWTRDGARCLAHQRFGQRNDALSCAPVDASCGDLSHFESGTRLMTEYQP